MTGARHQIHHMGMVAVLAVAALWTASAARADDADRIQPYPKNPYFWQYKGRPVLLPGGSDDDNLFQGERNTLAAQLDTLVACGGNYVRNAMSVSDEAQRILRSIRDFTSTLDGFVMQPRPDLLSHDDSVYLMAQPDRQYALGFDAGGSVQLDARTLFGPARLRWMNVHEGKWVDGGRVELGRISLQTPGDGLWMAIVKTMD